MWKDVTTSQGWSSACDICEQRYKVEFSEQGKTLQNFPHLQYFVKLEGD